MEEKTKTLIILIIICLVALSWVSKKEEQAKREIASDPYLSVTR